MYKLNENSITRSSDGACIPLVEDNRDYQEYLAWVAAGNTPDPYVPPPVPAPQTVTRRQGRLALIDAGKLVAVEAAIDATEDPIEKLKAQVEYEADTWERSNAFLQSMWAQLGGTEAELDNLFTLAGTK